MVNDNNIISKLNSSQFDHNWLHLNHISLFPIPYTKKSRLRSVPANHEWISQFCVFVSFDCIRCIDNLNHEERIFRKRKNDCNLVVVCGYSAVWNCYQFCCWTLYEWTKTVVDRFSYFKSKWQFHLKIVLRSVPRYRTRFFISWNGLPRKIMIFRYLWKWYARDVDEFFRNSNPNSAVQCRKQQTQIIWKLPEANCKCSFSDVLKVTTIHSISIPRNLFVKSAVLMAYFECQSMPSTTSVDLWSNIRWSIFSSKLVFVYYTYTLALWAQQRVF